MLWNNISFIGGFYKPPEEEAEGEEADGQRQRPDAQPARPAPRGRGRVAVVKGVPHAGATREASGRPGFGGNSGRGRLSGGQQAENAKKSLGHLRSREREVAASLSA